MTESESYAHAAVGRPWETIEQHLSDVVRLVQQNSTTLPGIVWAELAARWHDLGKYSAEFQDYLKTCHTLPEQAASLKGSVDHSSAGAQWAFQQEPRLGLILAYLIAGHHGGLLDHPDLDRRLTKPISDWEKAAPQELLSAKFPPMPQLPRPQSHNHAAFRVMFWLRMLFSALVDADFLATEGFLSLDKTIRRKQSDITLDQMRPVLNAYLNEICQTAAPTPINRTRAGILYEVKQGATSEPGFFSLCVPTGGGKTLTALSFALDHAAGHQLHRVIMAVPFTSIIEQNAQIYREIFMPLGSGVMVEHHSNLDPVKETELNRLQSENWDAPLIVTTTVQLYESLFANRTSSCRKLHRLTRSVIVLDEVQNLPVEVLKPTLWALRELVETYGCSVVLCSATLPAVIKREKFPIGLENVRPLIAEAGQLYEEMRRTQVTDLGVQSLEAISKQILTHKQTLCIVNTRREARQLAELIGREPGHYHLSTQMCAAHRLSSIQAIREKLAGGNHCRVISTQLIEAGVDLDFPVVYRARCGLDSLAQAAGRCNREGKLEIGEVYFFATEQLPPKGSLRTTAQLTEELLPQLPDLLSPESIEQYFRLYYWQKNDYDWDARQVLAAAGNNPSALAFQFATMAQRYRVIDDQREAIIIPWGETGKGLVEQFCAAPFPDRELIRKLQRYVVSVFPWELKKLETDGAVEQVHERWVLQDPAYYDDYFGLLLDVEEVNREMVI